MNYINRFLPQWISGYQQSWLRPDIMAGLITSAIVIPKAMAYATIAGLPVEIGIYTALIPMVIYAVTGTSRVLSVSTTTTLAILTGAEISRVVPDGDAASILSASVTLALMVGVILILASLLRLGFVANFISEPVLVGFKGGIAIVIILDQIPKLMGIHFVKGGFFENAVSILNHIPETQSATLVIGIAMILLLLTFEKFIPKAPAPLLVIAIGIGSTFFLGLESKGVEIVGLIPQGLPSFHLPDVNLIEALWPGALGIGLMSFTETIAAGRAFQKSGEPALIPNRELIASGLGNVGGAFLGAMPSGGGTSQTAVNRMSGAFTQLSGLVAAAMALLTILLIAPLLGKMQMATLAAVVIVYSIGLFKPSDFKAILKFRKTEFVWALFALCGVIILGTLEGILVAIIVSMLSLAQQTADPPLYILGRKPGTNIFRARSKEHPEDEEFPGLLILRPEGRLFFVNAARVGEKIRPLIESAKPSVLALEMSGIFDMEYTALKMLAEAEERLRNEGIEVWLVDINPKVFNIISNSPFGKTLTQQRMFLSIDRAVEKFIKLKQIEKK